MLKIRKYRRVIDALRQDRPGEWIYLRKTGYWYSPDRQERVVAVHTGGYDFNGEAMPGYSYYVYQVSSDEHLGVVYP